MIKDLPTHDIRLVSAVPVLPVLDLNVATPFYRDKLGFRPLFAHAGYAGFVRDRVELHLWECKNPELPKASSCRILVSNIERLYAELQAQGVIHPNGALETKPWNTAEFVALDQDGNALRFAEELDPGLA